MTATRHMAPLGEGAGYVIPGRDLAHEHAQWFELDLDDEFDDPDAPELDPLPTARHRTIPD